jgi:recombination associated protein RdgC
MFKNALVYRIDQWEPPTQTDIEQRLHGARFTPCGASQPQAAGWVAPRGVKHGALLESVGGQLVLTLCSETKPVPASAVKELLEARLDQSRRRPAVAPRARPSARSRKRSCTSCCRAPLPSGRRRRSGST